MSDFSSDEGRQTFDLYWSFLDTLSPRTRSFVLDLLVSPFQLSEQLSSFSSAERESIVAELWEKAPPRFVEGLEA